MSSLSLHLRLPVHLISASPVGCSTEVIVPTHTVQPRRETRSCGWVDDTLPWTGPQQSLLGHKNWGRGLESGRTWPFYIINCRHGTDSQCPNIAVATRWVAQWADRQCTGEEWSSTSCYIPKITKIVIHWLALILSWFLPLTKSMQKLFLWCLRN